MDFVRCIFVVVLHDGLSTWQWSKVLEVVEMILITVVFFVLFVVFVALKMHDAGAAIDSILSEDTMSASARKDRSCHESGKSR